VPRPNELRSPIHEYLHFEQPIPKDHEAKTIAQGKKFVVETIQVLLVHHQFFTHHPCLKWNWCVCIIWPCCLPQFKCSLCTTNSSCITMFRRQLMCLHNTTTCPTWKIFKIHWERILPLSQRHRIHSLLNLVF